MALRTGILRRLYWDASKTTIASLGAAAKPTHTELEGIFDKDQYVACVQQLPDFGAPPALVQAECFGEDVSESVASQATAGEGTITIYFDEGRTYHKELYNLAAGAPLLVAIFTVTTPGSGDNPKDPGETGVKGTFRIIEGTKAGTGLTPGGSVNDVETYQLGIAKKAGGELTVFDT